MNTIDIINRNRRIRLQQCLQEIENCDPSSFTYAHKEEDSQFYYGIRNHLIHEAVFIAQELGMKAGFNVHSPVQDIINKKWDHTWGVVASIELPTGLVSWHIESPDIKYDGHGYEEKHERITEFIGKDE